MTIVLHPDGRDDAILFTEIVRQNKGISTKMEYAGTTYGAYWDWELVWWKGSYACEYREEELLVMIEEA